MSKAINLVEFPSSSRVIAIEHSWSIVIRIGNRQKPVDGPAVSDDPATGTKRRLIKSYRVYVRRDMAVADSGEGPVCRRNTVFLSFFYTFSRCGCHREPFLTNYTTMAEPFSFTSLILLDCSLLS